MSVYFHENSSTFHLQNQQLSYVMKVLPNGGLGQLYFGKRIHDKEDFDYLLEGCIRSHSAFPDAIEGFSLEHVRQEYPVYGGSDFRQGAVEILQKNGSRLTNFVYKKYRVQEGKPSIPGLPAAYTEKDEDAQTLVITLEDALSGVQLELSYTIFSALGVLTRSARFTNQGQEDVYLNRAMSMSLDLPDADYDWMQFSGSWAREREPHTHRLTEGITAIESLRGHSSHQHNPFVILKRPGTEEDHGEAVGFSFVYSGNFLAQAEVDTYRVTRFMMGINPTWFSWKLEPGEAFFTPEVIMAYTADGLNALSQTYHTLYLHHLMRGQYRKTPRPILINNWEATYFDFNEEKLLAIAAKAKECGVEMFVLDDGWFGARRNDDAGLGDWVPAKELLPNGIAGLSEKIEQMGMRFGLWFEPEMVNPDSDLYRAHPGLGAADSRQAGFFV